MTTPPGPHPGHNRTSCHSQYCRHLAQPSPSFALDHAVPCPPHDTHHPRPPTPASSPPRPVTHSCLVRHRTRRNRPTRRCGRWLERRRERGQLAGAGFYSNSYGASVPKVLILFIAYHTTAPHHAVCGPCDEVCAVLPAVGECRPCPHYPCQVGRTTVDPSMLVSGRLQHVGSATLTGLLSEGTG
ncbi:hypothetical protein BHM03_00046683, partial [Ensete ventricosum]